MLTLPPRSKAVPSEMVETALAHWDGHLHSIAEHGPAAWQKASGYTKRARADAAIGRFKQVIVTGYARAQTRDGQPGWTSSSMP